MTKMFLQILDSLIDINSPENVQHGLFLGLLLLTLRELSLHVFSSTKCLIYMRIEEWAFSGLGFRAA